MSGREFLATVTLIVAMTALLAVVELVLPMFPRGPAQHGRGTANLGLMALTIAVNWALTSAAAVAALALSLQGPGWMTQLGVPLAVQIVASVFVLDFTFRY